MPIFFSSLEFVESRETGKRLYNSAPILLSNKGYFIVAKPQVGTRGLINIARASTRSMHGLVIISLKSREIIHIDREKSIDFL
jgi:hypothetical protein